MVVTHYCLDEAEQKSRRQVKYIHRPRGSQLAALDRFVLAVAVAVFFADRLSQSSGGFLNGSVPGIESPVDDAGSEETAVVSR